ncbi:response regulator [Marinobacterium arenosum]|uniref:response regulator n=1 Tax=Marinobacterium arenosum TaxID=2862496 RepID=UPI001C9499E4|nr:response regulator [Marinobacterium arenosum]MBY4677031.1 response regulator [Marinobacterium arenosum]
MPHRFTILMVTRKGEKSSPVQELLSRHTKQLLTAENAEQAAALLKKHQVSVLLLAAGSLQDNQVFFLHLVKQAPELEARISYRIVLCDKSEAKQAFELCRKNIFTDYFVSQPLYDPFHLLLRLRFLKQVSLGQQLASPHNVESLKQACAFLEHLNSHAEEVGGLNRELIYTLGQKLNLSLTQLLAMIDTSQDKGEAARRVREQGAEALIQPVTEAVKQAAAQVNRAASQRAEQGAQLAGSVRQIQQGMESLGRSVVVVSADTDQRNSLQTLLMYQGYQCHAFNSGTEFLQQLPQLRSELILIDCKQQDLAAGRLIEEVGRQRARQKHPPALIALIEPGDADAARNALHHGASDVMIKPVDDQLMLFKLSQKAPLSEAV